MVRSRVSAFLTRLACIGIGIALFGASAIADPVAVELPAQPLASALREFARQTGIQVAVPAELTDGKTSAAIKGSFEPVDALNRLLRGSGLSAYPVNRNTYGIRRESDVGKLQDGVNRTATSNAPELAQANPGLTHNSATVNSEGDQSAPQAQSPKRKDDEEKEELQEVVVTGTHIRGAALTSAIITIDRSTIDQSGYSDVGEVLRALPENFSGGQNPGVFGAYGNSNGLNTSSAASANLRGLGADSTLTLINGHRFAFDGFLNGVDLSIIPLAAVERVEVLTDGASSIYGSDAVAGVVNVILKDHFSGVEASATAGDSIHGGGFSQSYSLLGGNDWGSGDFLLAYEYGKANPLYASQRFFSADAAAPQTLLPHLDRNSVFAAMRQEITGALSFYTQGLFTSRTSDLVVNSFGIESPSHTDVKQYGIDSGFNLSLANGWTSSLDAVFSRDWDYAYGSDIEEPAGTVLDTSENRTGNDLWSVEAHASGPIVTLPSGALSLAAGGGYRSERYADSAPTYGARSIRYAFGELALPLVTPSPTRLGLTQLEINGAARFENYSDFGSKTTSKLGVLYGPTADLHIRATWAQSFRAPELDDVYSLQFVSLAPSPIFGGTSGDVLYARGANLSLNPETALSRTVGVDFSPTWRKTLKVSATYYDINYTNRLVAPVSNLVGSLSNPLYAPFIVTMPTQAQQAAFIPPGAEFQNFTGAPYNPQTVDYLLDDRFQNATSQRISGVDLTGQDSLTLNNGSVFTLSGNMSWLTIRQRLVSTAPETTLSGTIFNPPDFKARGSANYQYGPWGVTLTVNYVDWEFDNSTSPWVPIASWTTFDGQLAYRFAQATGLLHDAQISLSGQNLLDRAPPHVAATSTFYPGLGFDSTNASPLGRYVSLHLSKKW